MKVLNLTPECFVEIIFLGIFWEHWPPVHYKRGKGGWTTVDHVLKVFTNLGCVTQPQVSMVQGKKTGVLHQRAFFSRCGTTYGSEYAIDSRSWFLYRQGVFSRGKKPDVLKLVRNVRFELLEQSIQKAEELEKKYPELSKEFYLAEVKRIDELYKTSLASACASAKYRERVDQEICEGK